MSKKKASFCALRFRLLAETLRLDSSDVARALNVSLPTVSRLRMGHTKPTGATAKLIQLLWPDWWPFLTQQTNTIPNPQPQPEPVRVVEER